LRLLISLGCFQSCLPGTEGTKCALKTYHVIRKYVGKEKGEFGFEAWVEEKGETFVDFKAMVEVWEVWEGRIVDEKVFGKGFGEVTVDRVEKVMKDEKKFWACFSRCW
jgi:hypothetical protein